MNNDLLSRILQLLLEEKEKNTNIDPVSPQDSVYPIGQKVILRGYYAGVLYGELVSVNNGVYRIKNARRLYYWEAIKGVSLEDVANYGVGNSSKITSAISLCDVTDPYVCLLLPCTKEAIQTIEVQPDYIP